jgi:hypothetical protein
MNIHAIIQKLIAYIYPIGGICVTNKRSVDALKFYYKKTANPIYVNKN